SAIMPEPFSMKTFATNKPLNCSNGNQCQRLMGLNGQRSANGRHFVTTFLPPTPGARVNYAMESAQGRKEGQFRPRRQQGCEAPRTAQGAGRGDQQGAAEGDRLAAEFRACVPLGHHRQEDWLERHLGRDGPRGGTKPTA